MMETKKHHIFIVCISAFLVLGMVLSMYVAAVHARKEAGARAEGVLLDSAREQAGAFASVLGSRLDLLKSISVSLAMLGVEEPGVIEAKLKTLTSVIDASFSRIDLILPNGIKATAEEGFDTSVADREYFKAAMAGEAAMERVTGRTSGEVCVVLAVPYRRAGAIAGVVRATYYEEDLRPILNSTAYGGDGYSFLICGNGDIIVNTENIEGIRSNDNVLDILGGASFTDGDSREELIEDLASGESAALSYDFNGKGRIAVLVPLGGALPENDWFVLNIMDESRLSEEINRDMRSSSESIYVFAVFTAVALILFIFLERDYRHKKENETELTRQREQQFRIVTEQSGKFVMRYDIHTKNATLNDDSDGFGGARSFSNAAEETIRRGLIDASSEEDYRAFFRKIDSGESPVSAEILMIRPGGERRWYKHDSTTIFDKGGAPSTAIISYFDNTEQREREIAYAKWQQELESLPHENTALYEWNITKDIFEGARGALSASYPLADDTFDARAEYVAENLVSPEDRAEYRAMMNRERLIAMYISKTYRCSMDYRFLNEGGEYNWRRISVQLVPYPDGQDIKAYVTNIDIDEEKRMGLELLAKSEKDFLTGALNRETFIGRVLEAISHAPAASHAVMMLDVDGFKRVNDTLGHDAGDNVLRELVSSMHATLRASDIIGRIGGDEFMICLPDMPLKEAIAKKAEQLCAALRRNLNDRLSISVSIGIAVYPEDGATFEALYKKADAALYSAKGKGKDRYAFYQAGMAEGD